MFEFLVEENPESFAAFFVVKRFHAKAPSRKAQCGKNSGFFFSTVKKINT
jgi:hypothetical protein